MLWYSLWIRKYSMMRNIKNYPANGDLYSDSYVSQWHRHRSSSLLIAEHDLLIILSYRPSKLQLGSRRTRKALPQPVGITYAIVRARRTLAALQLPASSLILHLSLIHSLLPQSTPLLALYDQHLL
jgi:hypothetical protein